VVPIRAISGRGLVALLVSLCVVFLCVAPRTARAEVAAGLGATPSSYFAHQWLGSSAADFLVGGFVLLEAESITGGNELTPAGGQTAASVGALTAAVAVTALGSLAYEEPPSMKTVGGALLGLGTAWGIASMLPRVERGGAVWGISLALAPLGASLASTANRKARTAHRLGLSAPFAPAPGWAASRAPLRGPALRLEALRLAF
jgi:hypothetical protein